MITSTKERRAFHRMVINAPVTISQADVRLAGVCRDLSANGMGLFVESESLDPNATIKVNLATSNNLLPPFEAEARIIRITALDEGYLVAIEFVAVGSTG